MPNDLTPLEQKYLAQLAHFNGKPVERFFRQGFVPSDVRDALDSLVAKGYAELVEDHRPSHYNWTDRRVYVLAEDLREGSK